MEKYVIEGGRPLYGEVEIQSAKNAVLPLLAASVLTDERVVIHNCPRIADVLNMAGILSELGCKVHFDGGDLSIESADAANHEIPAALAKELRSSVFMLDDRRFLHEISKQEAAIIERYLGFNGYIDYDGNVTDAYRTAQETGTFAQFPQEIAPMAEGIHKLVQGIFDEKVLSEIIVPANKPKITENELNENFARKEFQTLWNYINHKYAYTVSFDSNELIEKAIRAIDEQMYVTELTYVRTVGTQGRDSLDFTEGKTKTTTLHNTGGSNVEYDLVGKISQGTTLTRKTVVKILQGIRADKFAMFKANPEEFISKAIRYIKEQKAAVIVDEITYNVTEEEPYGSDIFTMGKGVVNFDNAVKAERHITPWVVVDSDTEKQFARDLDKDEGDVCVYAKLPRTFKIPTPVGDYSPDWAIAFYEGKVKYIYFIAETKGSMESMQLKKIEDAKIQCAKKLFSKLNGGMVHYDVADTYQHLMDIMSR